MTTRPQFNLWPLALWPLLLFIALVPFLGAIDLQIASFFAALYPGFQVPYFVQFIYHYGTIPSLLIGLTALILLLTNIRPSWQKYRTSALMACVVLALTPGLLINGILKKSVERPRPHQIVQFGGKEKFAPLTNMKIRLHNRGFHSFPSGHASMGFFFLTLWRIALRERKQRLAHISLGISLLLILFLGWTRMAQGGHFFSDILAAGLFTWLTILGAEAYCYGKQVPVEH